MTRKSVGISLLVWALGMCAVFLFNSRLHLSESFTIAHVVGAACVGSLIDYLLFCRKKEINVCERCGKSLKGLRVIREDTCQFKKEGA
jgi:hypothetical protein